MKLPFVQVPWPAISEDQWMKLWAAENVYTMCSEFLHIKLTQVSIGCATFIGKHFLANSASTSTNFDFLIIDIVEVFLLEIGQLLSSFPTSPSARLRSCLELCWDDAAFFFFFYFAVPFLFPLTAEAIWLMGSDQYQQYAVWVLYKWKESKPPSASCAEEFYEIPNQTLMEDTSWGQISQWISNMHASKFSFHQCWNISIAKIARRETGSI